MQARSSPAQRIITILFRTGSVAVNRDSEGMDAKPGHGFVSRTEWSGYAEWALQRKIER